MMRLRPLNVICAHPTLLTWLVGAAVLDTFVLVSIARHSSWSVLLSPSMFGTTALALTPATLLGWFLGMFTCWPCIRRTCTRYNGAPFAVGERVVVLGGRAIGTVTTIYDTTKGQGGQTLLKLNLGDEMKCNYHDIFEEYSITRAPGGEPDLGQVSSEPAPEGAAPNEPSR